MNRYCIIVPALFVLLLAPFLGTSQVSAHSKIPSNGPTLDSDSGSGCLHVTVTVKEQTVPANFAFLLSDQFGLEAGQKVTVTIVHSDPTKVVATDLYSYATNTQVQFLTGGIGSATFTSTVPDTGLYDSFLLGTPGGTVHYTVTRIDQCPYYFANDGRVNPYDAQQTNTAYCRANGALDVWRVKESKGTYLFTAQREQIATGAVQAKKLGKPVLLGEKEGVQVWAIPGNSLQLHDAKGGPNPYHYVFSASLCG